MKVKKIIKTVITVLAVFIAVIIIKNPGISNADW